MLTQQTREKEADTAGCDQYQADVAVGGGRARSRLEQRETNVQWKPRTWGPQEQH
jgi:hypothetical protein